MTQTALLYLVSIGKNNPGVELWKDNPLLGLGEKIIQSLERLHQ